MLHTSPSGRLKIVCDDKVKYLKGVLEPFAEVTYLPGSRISAQDVKDAHALLVRTRTNCNAQLLQGSSVKFIGTATIGFDHIDTEWVQQQGITWTNAPGCNSGSVKQYIAALLALLTTEKGIDLKGKTLGIVGVGNVGRKVARVAAAFGMKVLQNDPPRERAGESGFVSFNDLLKQSDIVTFHVPYIKTGIDQTFHLFNTQTLDVIKPGAILINTSRGEVTATDAVLEGLNRGILSEAVLDVWENEPNISLPLLNRCFIATPHIAGYSVDGKAMGSAMTIRALAKYFGIPLTDWYPSSLPQPETPLLTLSRAHATTQQALAELVLKTYPLRRDDADLRGDTSRFEELRGSYPVRREFGAYQLGGDHLTPEIVEAWKGLVEPQP
ncbi:erythronate-4-phosphate dehydrogenase [Breznakibacter xylanolyticus]|uniref:Erythronate-4-phosphate dehydrogenase n=1 Tax=Breznakibacter xylanolyticus TaxID=990 RepID=A0A2W7P7A0_9BACT|nr:4-phosphoerythronate dehydrogenase [Breznakibacter xylanolyticus]PZX19282.1 erythronate-4-phosphate dehydrogenase [Breznakibacter xylanolyticus]